MTCRKCKKEAPDGAFCVYCGTNQEKAVKTKHRRGNGQGSAYKRGSTWTGQTTGYSYYTVENGKKNLHRVRRRKGRVIEECTITIHDPHFSIKKLNFISVTVAN